MMTSFAGNFEDVLLTRLFGGDRTRGTFIDIGACHARNGNCSWAFYERGWRGINVEPGPLFQTLIEMRPEDINLNAAVSDRDGRAIFHYHADVPATSTLEAELAPELDGLVYDRREQEVETLTLKTLRQRYLGSREVQFLKVDVEGYEAAVFSGCDWRDFRPQVIVAEATRPFTNEPVHAEWSSRLIEAGYVLTLFDGVNVWLVREEDPDLAASASLPVNQLDLFRPYDDEKTEALAELAALRARLAAVEASTSWRATAPLRRAVDRLRRQRVG